MPSIAVLGERSRVRGFALAGARIFIAEDDEAVRSAWRSMNGDIAVVILTPRAAAALDVEREGTGDSQGRYRWGRQPLWVVMPP